MNYDILFFQIEPIV